MLQACSASRSLLKVTPSGFPVAHGWLHTGDCGRLLPLRSSHSRRWLKLDVFRKTPDCESAFHCHCTPHSFGLSSSSPSKSGFKLFFCSISTWKKKKAKTSGMRGRERKSMKTNEHKEPQKVILQMFWSCCPNGTTIPASTTMPFKVWNPLFVVLLGNSYSLSCKIAPHPVGWPTSLWIVLVSLAPLFIGPTGQEWDLAHFIQGVEIQ